MKIALTNITAGGLCHGYRKYLHVMVPLLKQDPSVSSVTIFLPPQAKDLIDLKNESTYFWPENDHLSGFSWLKGRVRELSPDVVFIPNAQWADFGGIPTVVMPRNMEPLVCPLRQNSLRIGLANIVRYYLTARTCERADRIIAVSGFVKNILMAKFHIDSEKIGVVPFGAESFISKESRMPSIAEKDRIEHFIFTAGTLAPYRGLDDLIRALSLLKEKRVEPTLVIGGDADSGNTHYRSRMEKLAEKLGVSAQVKWAGRLGSDEMAWCYKNSALFVMTSRVEACPNIVLEAMSYGCLNISTDTPPMPEFYGDTAYYYKAEDARCLAGLILQVLNMKDHDRQMMRERAVARSRGFSWDVTLSKTIGQLQFAIRDKKTRSA